jgi:hypothetical protein
MGRSCSGPMGLPVTGRPVGSPIILGNSRRLHCSTACARCYLRFFRWTVSGPVLDPFFPASRSSPTPSFPEVAVLRFRWGEVTSSRGVPVLGVVLNPRSVSREIVAKCSLRLMVPCV